MGPISVQGEILPRAPQATNVITITSQTTVSADGQTTTLTTVLPAPTGLPPPSSSSSSTSGSGSSSDSNGGTSAGQLVGAVAGGIVGGFLLFAILLILACMAHRRQKRRRREARQAFEVGGPLRGGKGLELVPSAGPGDVVLGHGRNRSGSSADLLARPLEMTPAWGATPASLAGPGYAPEYGRSYVSSPAYASAAVLPAPRISYAGLPSSPGLPLEMGYSDPHPPPPSAMSASHSTSHPYARPYMFLPGAGASAGPTGSRTDEARTRVTIRPELEPMLDAAPAPAPATSENISPQPNNRTSYCVVPQRHHSINASSRLQDANGLHQHVGPHTSRVTFAITPDDRRKSTPTSGLGLVPGSGAEGVGPQGNGATGTRDVDAPKLPPLFISDVGSLLADKTLELDGAKHDLFQSSTTQAALSASAPSARTGNAAQTSTHTTMADIQRSVMAKVAAGHGTGTISSSGRGTGTGTGTLSSSGAGTVLSDGTLDPAALQTHQRLHLVGAMPSSPSLPILETPERQARA